jgi:MFS family permease
MIRGLGGDLRWLLSLAAVSTVTQAIRPTASYRTLELGGNAATVGAVAAAFALLSVVTAIPLGVGIDRFGARRFLVGGVGLLLGSALLCAAASNVAVLGVAQGLVGLGQVSFVLAVQSIIANRRDKDAGFAMITVFGGTGQLLGPLIAGFLVGAHIVGGLPGTVSTFLISAAVAVFGLLLALSGTRNLDVRPPAPAAGRRLRDMRRTEGLGQALLISIVMSTAVEMMVVYLPVLGAARGISPAVIGSVLGIRAISALASRLALARIVGRIGRNGVLLVSLTGSGLAMLAIATSPWVWLIYLSGVLVGFGLGVGAPLTMAMVAATSPPGTRAAAMALRATGDRIGLIALAVTLGALASVLGAGVVFLAVGGSLLGSTWWVRRSHLGDEVDPTDSL